MTHVKLNKSFDESNIEQKQGVIKFIEDFKNDPAIKHMKVNGNVAFVIEEGEYVGRKVLRDYLIENKLEDRKAVYDHLVKKLSEEIKYYKSEDPQIPEMLAKIGDIHKASLKDISDVVEQYAGGLTPRYRKLMNHFKALKSENLSEKLFKGRSSPYADELKKLEFLIGEEFADPQMLEEYLYENEDEYPLLTKLARKNWDKFLDTVNPMFDAHYKEIQAREETLRNIEARKQKEMATVEEGKRPLSIMKQFKKGFEALDKAFATIPSVQKALTEFRFKVGSDDFNGDYVIVIGFDKEIADIQNVYHYLNGDKDKVKMTSKWSKEKAAAVLINGALEYDDAYLMDSPAETLLYITNATPTNEYMQESKSLRESFDFDEDAAFANAYKMTSRDFDMWKATTKGLTTVKELDEGKAFACYIPEFSKEYGRQMLKHIGTYVPSEGVLYCDDAKYFGHLV